jgi:hypothetical protein
MRWIRTIWDYGRPRRKLVGLPQRTLLEEIEQGARHVKLRREQQVNAVALSELIAAAYRDIRSRLRSLP